MAAYQVKGNLTFAIKKLVRKIVVASVMAGAAATTAVAVTGTPALAINPVPCGRSDFLRISVHTGDLPIRWYSSCYANRGITYVGNVWLDEISTGNNDVKLYDYNGSVVHVGRWWVITYPNAPKHIWAVEIL